MDGIASGGKADPYYKFFLDSDEIIGDRKDARKNKLEGKWGFIPKMNRHLSSVKRLDQLHRFNFCFTR